MSNEIENKSIENVLTGVLEGFKQENIELFKKLYGDKKIEIKDPETFFFEFIYPHEKLMDGLINSTLGNNNELVFLLTQYKFIECHFEKLIQRREGHSCCADKSRTIMRSLFKHFVSGEKIEFNYEAEYIFHLPEKIFKTHDDILDFKKSLKMLKKTIDEYDGHDDIISDSLDDFKSIKENCSDNETEFRMLVQESEAIMAIDSEQPVIYCGISPQFHQFWIQLWPIFVEALQFELKQMTQPQT